MNAIHYPPNSIGARLWGTGSGPIARAPIAIPREIARAAAQPGLERASHPFIAFAAVAAVSGLALLAYAVL